MTMHFLSASTISRAAVVSAMLAGIVGCAPRASETTAVAGQAPQAQGGSTPVLLSCPAGQQPLLRQVLVNGAAVPQVECVSAASAGMTAAPAMPVASLPVAYAAQPAPAPVYAAPPVVYQAAAPIARPRTQVRPQARRVVYEDDIVEYKRPAKRSWQKSALIIGSAAGAGAGVGAATGGKKGALIGAAVGGGAATLWDQVTRRQPR